MDMSHPGVRSETLQLEDRWGVEDGRGESGYRCLRLVHLERRVISVATSSELSLIFMTGLYYFFLALHSASTAFGSQHSYILHVAYEYNILSHHSSGQEVCRHRFTCRTLQDQRSAVRMEFVSTENFTRLGICTKFGLIMRNSSAASGSCRS